MEVSHLSDGDLERYVTGMIHDKAEVQWVEDHLYRCPECAERMWAIEDHVDDPESGSGQTGEGDLYREGGPLQ